MATKIADYFVAFGAQDFGLNAAIDGVQSRLSDSASQAQHLGDIADDLWGTVDALKNAEKEGKALRATIVKGFVGISAATTASLVTFMKWEKAQAKARVEARLFGKQLNMTDEAVDRLKKGMMQEELAGTFTGAVGTLTDHVYALTAAFGECVAVGLSPLLPYLEEAVTWLTGLDDNTRQWIAGLTLATIALTGFISVFPSIDAAVDIVIATLAFLLSPIGLVVAGIAAISAIMIECWGTGDTFGQKLVNVFKEIIGWVESVIDVFRNFDLTWELIQLNFTEALINMGERLTNFIVRAIDYLSWFFDAVTSFDFSKDVANSADPLTDLSKEKERVMNEWQRRTEARNKKTEDNAKAVRDKFLGKTPDEIDKQKKDKAALEVKPQFFSAAEIFKKNILGTFAHDDEQKKQAELQKQLVDQGKAKILADEQHHKELIAAVGKIQPAVGM